MPSAKYLMRNWINLFEAKPENWRKSRPGVLNSLEDIEAYAASIGVEMNLEMRGDDDIMLLWINRAPRRKGSGNMAMWALIDYANAHNCMISLCVTDQRGKSALVSYYEGFGFEVDEMTYEYEPMMTYFPPSMKSEY